MKLAISLVSALLLAGGLAATGTAIAAEDVHSQQAKDDIQSSSETLQTSSAFRRLALALSSGSEAMGVFHGPRSKDSDEKDRLNPPIPGIACDIDRVLNYVSCFGPVISNQEQAGILFTQLVNELQTALPPDRWTGMKAKPGIDAIQSYTYEDQKSAAHIDIDIVAQVGLEGQSFYVVSIFAWTY